MKIVQRASPNYNERPNGGEISAIVIHADAGSTEEGTLSWVEKEESQVSYHYLVGRDGTVYQCVDDVDRAWHAGISSFAGVEDVNDYSIGVAFANDQRGEEFTPDQMLKGARLVANLCKKHGIPLDRITTHAAISPGRKHDPGPKFNWYEFLGAVDTYTECFS
jgi:N-acetylmuramoyl-L-alanine amidase